MEEEWPIHWLHLIGTNHIRITRKSSYWFRQEWKRLMGDHIDLSQIRYEHQLKWVRQHTHTLINQMLFHLDDHPNYFD